MNEPDRIEPTLDTQPPAAAGGQTGPQAASEAGADSQVAGLQAQIADLQAQQKELAEQYLRAQADMQNTRRRADEEMSRARKFAVESFAEAMLPVVDSLEAGLAHKDATVDKIHEGAEITLRQLKSALERNKVVAIDPAPGTKFDPHQHQAISVVPGTSQEPNTVVGVLQKGYLISDRVLRPALVTVSG